MSPGLETPECTMAEELLLDYVIDQPYVPLDNEETGLKVLLKITPGAELSRSQATVGTHLALVLDVSSSMKSLELGAIKKAAKASIDMLRPGDAVSVIAFQSVVYDVIPATRIESREQVRELKRRIDTIDSYQGGGTNMEYAIEKAEEQLASIPDPGMAKKIILFTDGQVTGVEDKCLDAARGATERGVSIDALGFGTEFDYSFMQRLVSFSNGYTEKIDRAEDIEAVFGKRVAGLTNAVASNVSLTLTFTSFVRAGRGYRYGPEMAYLGNIRLPGDTRTITIPIGSIERDREYSYLVTCATGQRDGGNVRIIKATLEYDIPSMGVERGASTQSVVVAFSDDPTQLGQFNGEVERVFDEVEIGRLVGELDKATRNADHKRASIFFDILAKRYQELGDDQMQEHYLGLKDKYVREGALSQEDMNYSRHKSTQRRDSGVRLVDASDLI
jgi:Ca-activated chloride channel family protein